MTSLNALQNPQSAQGAQTAARQLEIQQAIQDAQKAVEAATREAMAASQQAQAASADRDLARTQSDAGRGSGVIVIPGSGDGPPVRISVDKAGIHVMQSGRDPVTIPIRDVVPRGAVQISFFLSAALVAVAVVGPLLRFFLRRFERRSVTASLSASVQERLDAMERNIDTVAVELERVSEGQRFTNRLLEQRPMEHAQRIDR